jgi:hypothetical protein
VVSVPTGQLDAARAAIRAATGFDTRFDHFPLTGMCAGCSDRVA